MEEPRRRLSTGSRGTLVGECRGATPLCPPQAWLVGHCRQQTSIQTRVRRGCPSPFPGDFKASQQLKSLDAGNTKGTSVVYHGSSWKRPPAARGGTPLTPASVARWV